MSYGSMKAMLGSKNSAAESAPGYGKPAAGRKIRRKALKGGMRRGEG